MAVAAGKKIINKKKILLDRMFLLTKEGVIAFDSEDGENYEVAGLADNTDISTYFYSLKSKTVSPLMTAGTIYFETTDSIIRTMVEISPRTILYKYKQQVYNHEIPYIYFIISAKQTDLGWTDMGGHRIFARKTPLRSLNDMLYTAPLHNIYTDTGNICWGYSNDYKPFGCNEKGVFNDLRTLQENIMHKFFTSEFNDDLGFIIGGRSNGPEFIVYNNLIKSGKADFNCYNLVDIITASELFSKLI